MDDPDSWLLFGFLLCVLLAGFFSSAESAFIAVPRLRIRYLSESGVQKAKQVARVLDRPERLLSNVLLGNNLVHVAAASIGTLLCVAWFGLPWGPVIATAGVTGVVLLFGELLPKTMAIHHAERMTMAYVYPMRLVEYRRFPAVALREPLAAASTASESRPTVTTPGCGRACPASDGGGRGGVAVDQAEMLLTAGFPTPLSR